MNDNPWGVSVGHIKRIGDHIRIAPYEKHPYGHFTYVSFELVGYTEGGYCESAFPLKELYEYLHGLKLKGVI